jgi:hypothetical protein
MDILNIISKGLNLNLSRLRQFKQAKEIMNDMQHKSDMLLLECGILKSYK